MVRSGGGNADASQLKGRRNHKEKKKDSSPRRVIIGMSVKGDCLLRGDLRESIGKINHDEAMPEGYVSRYQNSLRKVLMEG